MRRKLGSLGLATILAVSLVPAAAMAAPEGEGADLQPSRTVAGTATAEVVDDGPSVESREYFVWLAGAPAALNTGVGTGTATAMRSTDGTYDFQAQSSATAAYRAELAGEQAEVATIEAAEALGRELDVLATATVANHGFLTEMTAAEARQLASVDGVVQITQMPEYVPMTDRGPAWSGAEGPVWQRPDLGEATGVTGEGIVVGVIDTGINPSNPSFAAESADGYVHENPRDKYYGSCDPTNVPGGAGEPPLIPGVPYDSAYYDPDLAELCNDKLIGMWGYDSVTGRPEQQGRPAVPGTPLDYDGHGSHTAGTAAGGFVDDVQIEVAEGVDIDDNSFDIAGVAPHANIISYGACCTGAALITAIDQILLDDIDVLNFSIGSISATPDLLADPITVGFLVAELTGIHIANSAGNQGPLPGTVGGPSDAPWLLSVAASTHDRLNGNALVDITGADDASLPDIAGKGITEGLPSTPIVYAGDFDNPLCLPDVWDDDVFDGQIVICDRGETGRVDKSIQAAAAGAGGFVLANDEINAGSVPGSLNGDVYAVPGLHITYDDGVALKAWVAETDDPTAAVAGTNFQYDEDFADIVTVFSSRGPNGNDPNILSPHVTAPGMDILAAYGTDDAVEFQAISGTSMSGPHAAGALALVADAFGGVLSPAQARSALQLTARPDVWKTDGETPADAYDVGSGHIDVGAALDTGLVMHEDFLGYVEALLEGLPAPSGETLNLPSMVQTQCVLECSWTRTVTGAPGTGTVAWEADAELESAEITVEPSSFELAAGESQELTITATPDAVAAGVDTFGAVELTTEADVSDARLPVVIRSEGFAPVDAWRPGNPLTFTSEGYSDGATTSFVAAGAPDLQVSADDLVPGDLQIVEVAQDSTPGNPFDDLSEVVVLDVEVTEDDPMLLADLGETTAPDLDLFVGRYDDEDDEPSAAGVLCLSTTAGSDERCVIEDPEPGTYWVLIQSWQAGPTGSDSVVVTTVPGEGTPSPLEVDAPSEVEPGDTFELALSWDLAPPSLLWFGSLTLGSSPDEPEQLTVPIEIEVVPGEPEADAGGPYRVTVGQPLDLDGTGSSHPTDGLEITDYTWDLSELGLPEAEGAEPQVVPAVTGDFEISLTVQDTVGQSDTDTAEVTVVPGDGGEPPPVDPGEACDDISPVRFSDVIDGPHADNIGCAAGYGVALGKGDGTYDPAGSVRRDQMASFLARVLAVAGVELPDAPEARWPDVVDGPHALAIDQLTELGIIEGRRGGERYDPAGQVTRAQMASFLIRTLEEVVGESLEAPPSPFTDTEGSVHAGNIDVAYALGITQGRTATTYGPQENVRRDQMASFLARTLGELVNRDVELTPIR